MRNQMKRVAATVLVIAIAIVGCMGLSACSSTSGASSSGSSAEASSNAASSTTSDATSSASAKSTSADASYADTLFDTSIVHTVDVNISDEDWADLRANPLNKTKYKVNVTIDGEEVDEVSFATKGNTSLSSVASDADSDRYSFKINFGKYVDGQTYHGLDKLNLNNLYADATYMKDYLSYEISRAAGVDAPLTSYVQLKVNGQEIGLYLAIEEVDSSYVDRTHDGEGELYKPETEMLANMDQIGGGQGGAGGFNGAMPEGFSGQAPEGFSGQAPEGFSGQAPQVPEGFSGQAPNSSNSSSAPQGFDGTVPEGFSGQAPEGFGGGMPGGFGGGFGGDSGASLKYTDDQLSSYSDIFDNAETKVTEEDEQRVVTALKNLSEGNVEAAVDTDEVIRYFAAHNFVMSYDSYTGSMLHNYYLYENDGKLAMIPWDYNLAFGAFGGGNTGGFGGGMPGGFGGGMPGATSDSSTSSSSSAAPSANANSASAQAADAGASPTDASAIVNCGIDTPLSGADEADRPMWSWIASSDEYLKQYHEDYDELLTSYFESGTCQKEIERVRAMIAPYVESDPSAFYSSDEFKTAVDTLEAFVDARAKSIRAQLDGTLSTKTDEQDKTARIDASGIEISAMGSQGGGRR